MRLSFLKILLFLTVLVGSTSAISQKAIIGVNFGRYWAAYSYIDDGSGFDNARRSNWSNYPTVTLNTGFKGKSSLEYFFSYARYAQYFSTNRYSGAFFSHYGVGFLGVHYTYSLAKSPQAELRVKAGGAIGVMPDQYEGFFERIHVYPYVDSITRGTINRSFTPVFPVLSLATDFTFKVTERWGVTALFDYNKGFFPITEYDIFYNNGSGNNDQHAKQWGKGDYLGIQVGVKYWLK